MLHEGKWNNGKFTITGWWKLRHNNKFLIILDPQCGVQPTARISDSLDFGIWKHSE